jgi:hypothetical protein
MELLDGVFHFHPAMYEYYASHPEQKGILEEQKLFFHICIQPHKNYDDPLAMNVLMSTTKTKSYV